MSIFRTCLHKKCVQIFEHNFVADKAKIRRRAFARQGFLTQSAAKFAEKTCAYACEDRFLMYILKKQSLFFAVPHKLSACSAGNAEAQVPLGIELYHIHSFGSEERRK